MVRHLASQVFVYLNAFLILAVTAAVLLRLRRREVIWRMLPMLACAIVPLVPFKGLMLAEYFRSAFGDLSITTLLWLGIGLWSQLTNRPVFSSRERRTLFVVIAGGGLILYPATLGLGPVDPYHYGFGSSLFLFMLLCLAILCIVTERSATAITIIAAALAFDLHALESRNLWDYLIDPFVTVYALVSLTAQTFRWSRTTVRRSTMKSVPPA